MKFFVSVALFLLLGTVIIRGENPGIEITVDKSGLALVVSILRSKLERVGSTLHVADQSQSKLKVKNVKITRFAIGRSSGFQTSSPNLFKVIIDNTRLTISGRVEYTIKVGWIKKTIAKNVEASADKIRISQTIGLTKTSDGKPSFTISDRDCEVSLGGFDVDITNGGLWNKALNGLLNLFRGKIKKSLEKELKKSIPDAIEDMLNDATEGSNVNFPLLRNININMALLHNPSATSTSLTASVRGRCYPRSGSPALNFPFNAPALSKRSSGTRMARIAVSDYVLNTMLYSMHLNGELQRTLTQNSVSSIVKPFLSIDALSSYVTDLRRYRRRDALVEVVVEAPRAPMAEFDSSGITLTGTVQLSLVVVMGTTRNQILNLPFDVVISGAAEVENNRIVGKITHVSAAAAKTGFPLRGFPLSFVNQLVKEAISEMVLPGLNEVAESGFKLPKAFNYYYENPLIEFKEHTLEVASDFTYRGSKK